MFIVIILNLPKSALTLEFFYIHFMCRTFSSCKKASPQWEMDPVGIEPTSSRAIVPKHLTLEHGSERTPPRTHKWKRNFTNYYFTYHYYYLPIIIIICLSLLLFTYHYYYFTYHYYYFTYHYYYLPIIIIICLSLLLFRI